MKIPKNPIVSPTTKTTSLYHVMKFAPTLILLSTAVLSADTGLTVYNENFAVVRDDVPLRLEPGTQEAVYSGVTSQLEPESVVLRDPTGEVPLKVVEQSYRGDPVNQQSLLQMNEGETIRFLKVLGDTETIVSGRIVRAPAQSSSGYLEPIIEVDGELLTQLPGQPLFPDLGDDSILQPTLNWKLYSPEKASLAAELSYLTGGLSWKADYNLILPQKGDEVTLAGWVSVSNQSGKTFRDTSVKLIAGDVNKVQQARPVREDMMTARASMAAAPPPQVEERKFDEFHLYQLPSPIDLRDRETKQVEFVRADPVETRRIYVYQGSPVHAYRGSGANESPGFGRNDRPDVAVYREFVNSEDNNLGVPLPGGTVRFYRSDIDGQIEFIGENTIDHTPKDETIRLKLGNAFDLIGERTQTDFFRHRTQDLIRESFAIEIRNRSEEDVVVQIVESLYRAANWKIPQASSDWEKVDSNTIRFPVSVAAESTETITYTVEYTW